MPRKDIYPAAGTLQGRLAGVFLHPTFNQRESLQQHAEENGYGVVRSLVGHGIGENLHEDPDVPNFGTAGKGLRLRSGMTIAVEPMINLGAYKVFQEDDGWTIKTADGKISAHYENTIAILDSGVEILTLVD